MSDERVDMKPLLESIVESVPSPDASLLDAPFTFAVNNIGHDSFLGKLITGKVHSGKVQPGMKVKTLSRSGKERKRLMII